MKQTIILILLSFGLTTYGQTSFSYQRDYRLILSKTKDLNDNLFYDKLLKRFVSKDTTLTDYEVLSLMIGFTDKPEYNPYEDIVIEREVQLLNKNKKYNDALEKANKYLKTHPVSRNTLYEKSYALSKLEQYDSSNFYNLQSHRIIKAMSFSGDGKTANTPIFILNFDEPLDFITIARGAYIGSMRSEKDKEGNFLYVRKIIYRQREEEPMDLYFIIQHAANKKFGGKSMEEHFKLLENEYKNRLNSLKK